MLDYDYISFLYVLIFILKEQFQIHIKIEKKVQIFHILLTCPVPPTHTHRHTHTAHVGTQSLPHCQCSPQDSTFVTTDEPTLTHNYSKSIVTLEFMLDNVQSVGLVKCIMTCIHHYSILKSIFTALKILLLVHSSLHPPNPWQPMILLLSHQFCLFQNVIYLESYSMEPFHIGFFYLTICI